MTEDPDAALAAARNFLVGLTADRFVAELPKLLPDVVRFSFKHYRPTSGVEDRLTQRASLQLPPELEALKTSSPALHQQIVSFLSLLRGRDTSPEVALGELLLHDDSSESTDEFQLDGNELMNHGIAQAQLRMPLGVALGLSSICIQRDGTTAHIPMLDFRLPIEPNNVELIRSAATKLGLAHGAILESGRSYHVYGLCSYSVGQWSKFMTRALLLAPIVDVRYVAHRLLAGRGVLRVTAVAAKPYVPHVIAVF